jgi:hypothetical protein
MLQQHLGAFVKQRKATNSSLISLIPSVRPSVRTVQLGSHRTDFHEIRYLRIFRKSVEETLVSLKYDKNNADLTHSPVHIYDNTSLNSL